nr:DUF393 domain-containing protein [Pseudomarimonas arenosa]
MLLVHLLTFDPAWLSKYEQRAPATVLFDGHCAFCHATVRIAIHEDAEQRLCFAPLSGETAASLSDTAMPFDGDDSIVVVDQAGRRETKSRAVAAVLERLGGLWLPLAWLLRLLPRGLADYGYDLLGRWRYLLAGRIESAACRVVAGSAHRLLP